MIDNIDTVRYTLNYIVSGYITLKVISCIMPIAKKSDTEILVQSIGYSVLNRLVWTFAFIYIENKFSANDVLFTFLSSILFITAGMVTGIVVALIRKYKLFKKVLALFNIGTINAIPTAWDYVFSQGDRFWVEIEVSSGKQIRGLFSDKNKKSTIFCSQWSPEGWHEKLGNGPIADAILDRIVNSSYTMFIEGKSMREEYSKLK